MPEQPQKLDLKSMDITEEKKQQFKQLFPDVFHEDEIDFDHLKRVLSKEWDVENLGKERFGLQWPGKAACMKIIQQPSVATLKPDRDESVNFADTQNLFMEGDNLEVLKLLQKSYFGKVKMIYIDPPYNTGNEFIYPDNYSESLDTYLKYTGQKDEEGHWQTTNRDTDGRFHSRWLNMMYPRLFLAKNLLREDGVIFISIDDGEIDNLKKLCNEIFGEENFIANLVWKSRQNIDNRNVTNVSNDHEYILCYGNSLRGKERKTEQYTNPDNDPRGPWVSANMVGLLPEDRRPNLHYNLVDPHTDVVYKKPEMGWRYDENTMNRLIKEDKILWPESPDGRPRRKKFLSELQEKYVGFSSVIADDIYTRDGSKEIEELFGVKIMDFPKPSELIHELIEQGSSDKDDDEIIIDFFAGSCSTAHAMFNLSEEDNKNRRFIMVQLPEKTDEGSEAKKQGFNTIADIGKERIRRVIKQIENEDGNGQENQAELELEEESANIDLGFKVFKLEPSNFNVWDAPGIDVKPDELEEQLDAFADHITPEAEQESILYELILKSGYPLTTSVKQKEIDGKTVYSIQDDALLIYLDEGLNFEMLEHMAEWEPERIVCLDQSFTGDQADALKTNAVQLFKSQDIAFRTV